jgi:Nitrate/TMAO reductases, membrane-bound tetraheme cytochrome c subunit
VSGSTTLVVLVILTAIVLVGILVFRPTITATRGGKILAFVALLVFPLLGSGMGIKAHIEHSTSTKFCLSCHVMEPYGKSLLVDDRSYLPAVHYQYGMVSRDHACFTCHTDYAMFGDMRAKMRGLKHVYKYYIGTPSDPIKLYSPYNNRECLHCHLGTRAFEEGEAHNKDPQVMMQIKNNQKGCTTSGCHNIVHNVKDIKDATFWKDKIE